MRVEVRVTGNRWTCEATVVPSMTAEDRESFDVLMKLDPLFTLRIDEENTLLVNAAVGEDERLILTAYQTEPDAAGSRQVQQ
ncbi:hypothetical protein [Streptomyces sp. NPDC059378]|uniref:hypothetical protein n=1 Tax=Streptomyces sp. NPDC059378 TaxID=3346815 RepID=UPI003687615C